MAESEEATITLPELISESSVEEVDGATNDRGYVYLLAECRGGKPNGNFKVGTATDPNKRKRDLQTGNVNELKFCGEPRLVSNRLSVEKRAHAALSKYAVYEKGGKEWFRATSEIAQCDLYERFDRATK